MDFIPSVADKLKSDRLWAVTAFLALVPMEAIALERLALAAAVVGLFILGKSWRPAGASRGGRKGRAAEAG